MALDFDGIATALAARFAAGALTAPAGGYDTIRVATADIPAQLPPLPTVLVLAETGAFTAYPGKRDGTQEYAVRFYYNQAGDTGRDQKALRLWLAVLVDQLKGATQLGGIVTAARISGWTIGLLPYGGYTYSGIELRVHVVTNEPWQAVA